MPYFRWLSLAGFLFLIGCTGNIRYIESDASAPPNPSKAYVTNPELEKEVEILRASGLYTITADPDAPTRITLHPLMERPGGCGNPYLATYLTLGLVPAAMPADYVFAFTIEDRRGPRQVKHWLRMDYTVSLWESFKIFHDENEELGKALRASALESDSEMVRPVGL